MQFFQNETESVSIDGLAFVNRLDRIIVSGGLDLTLDRAGMLCSTKLLALVVKIQAANAAAARSGLSADQLASLAPAPPRTMKYFQNEEESVSIDGLAFENRLDRIAVSGELELTLDRAGALRCAQFMALVLAINTRLLAASHAGLLPDQLSLIAPTPAGNLFGLPDGKQS